MSSQPLQQSLDAQQYDTTVIANKIFVGGLSNDVSEEDLQNYFSRFAEVTKTEVIVSGDGASRGFGFVTFANEEMAQVLLGGQHVIKNRKLDCRPALLPGIKEEGVTFQPAKIFVGGLSSDTTQEVLYNYFSLFGGVKQAEVMKDHMTDKSRGFGFVEFENEQHIQNIFRAGAFHLINGRYCEVKKAMPRQVVQQRQGMPNPWGLSSGDPNPNQNLSPNPNPQQAGSSRAQNLQNPNMQYLQQQQHHQQQQYQQQQQQVMYVPYPQISNSQVQYPFFTYPYQGSGGRNDSSSQGRQGYQQGQQNPPITKPYN